MLIVDHNLTIRNATSEDAKLLCDWWNDGKVMAHAGFPHGLGITEQSIREQIPTDTDDTYRRLVIEVDSTPIGEMSYRNIGYDSAEIGIKICNFGMQGKGYGSRLLRMLIQELFNMGYVRVVLDTNLENERAQHVYEKLGFRKVGIRIDAWVDQLGVPQSAVDYELTKSEFIELEKLRAQWEAEEQYAFGGWDFSHLDNRWEEGSLPWDYKLIVSECIKPSDNLLDMGTGGGEFLLTLDHPYELTSVTESYPPNVELGKKKLALRGIEVRQVLDDSNIPYETDAFDIVINRHESFDVGEVSRMLKSGGYFITQQVGGTNNHDLSAELIADYQPQYPHHDLGNNIRLLGAKGFEIVFCDEAFPKTKFFDIGAFVYFAKIIEWEFPGFSVDACFGRLCKLERELREKTFVAGTEHRFVIVAQNRKKTASK